MPVLDAHTVTVSPFSGGADICPPDHTAAWVSVSNTRVSVSADNFLRVASVLFPPEHASLARVCCQGFSDALRFLETRSAAVPWRVWSLARSEEACLLQITKVTRVMGRHLLHVHTIESMLVCLIITNSADLLEQEFELGAGAPEHGLQLLVSRLPCGPGLLQLGRAQVRNTLVRHTASHRVTRVTRVTRSRAVQQLLGALVSRHPRLSTALASVLARIIAVIIDAQETQLEGEDKEEEEVPILPAPDLISQATPSHTRVTGLRWTRPPLQRRHSLASLPPATERFQLDACLCSLDLYSHL